MTGVTAKLKVIKADGSVEEYLHTKVIGALSNALSRTEGADIGVVEHLAEVVTYFLYHKRNHRNVTSGEIFSSIKAALAGVKFEDAAIALNEYHYLRKLKRSRIEVVSADICELADAEFACGIESSAHRSRWNKSVIVADLMAKYEIDRQTARAIAGMVEEKIFSMGISIVPTSLIKQLVLSDTAAVLHAGHELQTI